MHTQILTSKYGAELISFKINGEEKIHQGEDCVDENGKVYWKKHWPVLFPTVGKCKKNQTIINGKTYETQIDGFIRDMEFEPVTKLDNFHSYIYKSNKKTIEKYPYEFSLTVTYRLDENKLTTIYKVINEGDTDMPFGIGSKPALKLDKNEADKENYYLEFEEEEKKIHFLYLVDGLIGTEYAKNIIVNDKQILLNEHTFDNDALIVKGFKSNKITLKNKKDGKPIFTVDYTGFPYLAIWSKAKSPFICIEPWMTTPDNANGSGVFRQKNDILLLPPKKEFECKYTVEFF
ncbi:MAG: aldose 1-epimerase family protein [Clostridiaceae bacterium]|nr:aldose 1-epimerase family protein [Clostridiaceae bacterium]